MPIGPDPPTRSDLAEQLLECTVILQQLDSERGKRSACMDLAHLIVDYVSQYMILLNQEMRS